ncbi:MAG: glycoside hydrolase [Chitinophagaceae bacterium BSSC1]|nr:MAG: glycoside hydrolase [Chitinophagaceae bacterium BSSC1]
MKNKYLIACLLLIVSQVSAQKKDYNIKLFGAKADGRTNNAIVIQNLIDKASAAGGGRIIVPPGNYMTGTLELKTGVDLHIELGAVLLGSTYVKDYRKVAGRAALIMANGQSNIAISGEGIIDGQGQELMLDIFKQLRSGALQSDTIWLVKRPGVGRALGVIFYKCKGIKVTDITLKNTTDWVQDYRGCENLVIDRIKVQSTAYWNNDGLDVTDSKHVKITNCFINASDDALCFKSEDLNSDGCDDIVVDNCTLRSSANGLKFGTANGAGFRNFKITNLTVYDTYRSAIALESVDGGVMENIDIRNVDAKNTGNAIFIRLGHRNKTGPVSTLNGIYIANVTAEIPLYKPDQGYPIEGPPDHLRPGFDKMPIRPSHFHIYGHPFLPYNLVPSSIVGIPGHPVKNVVMENINIVYGGRASKEIAQVPLDKIHLIPENEEGYPEFSMFGELPAWGFYMRHAEGIQFKNFKISYKDADFRPAMVFDDVKNVQLNDVQIPSYQELPMLYFNNSKDVIINKLVIPIAQDKAIQRVNKN